MPLVTMKSLLTRAQRLNIAVGAFSVGNMEMVMGAIRASEETQTPIIIQIAESRLATSPLYLMAPLMVTAADRAKTDICVHLDHGLTLYTVEEALRRGFTSVMLDESLEPFDDNVASTRLVVSTARQYGASVEAELGVVGGSEGEDREHNIQCTDPDMASEFCWRTGIDAFAVAIGNSIGRYDTAPELRFDLLERIHRKCTIPLVLHGGTGTAEEDFRRCIQLGVRKINIATANYEAVVKAAREGAEQGDDFYALSRRMTEEVCETVKHLISVFNME